MSFSVDPPVSVISSGYGGDERYIRFNHGKKSWQRKGSYGWFNITVPVARMLFDQGFKVWGVE
jgi:hypothetical protein